MKYRVNSSLQIVLAIADLVLILTALYSSSIIRDSAPWGAELFPSNPQVSSWALYLLVAASWLSVTLMLGTYRTVQNRLAYQDVGHLLKAIIVTAMVLAGLLFFLTHGASRLRFSYLFLIAIPLLTIFRLALRVGFRLIFGQAWGTAMIKAARVVVVGEGAILYDTLCTLSNCDPHEIAVLGYIDYQEDLVEAVGVGGNNADFLDSMITGPLSDGQIGRRTHEESETLIGVARNGTHGTGVSKNEASTLTVLHPIHTSASARAASRWGLVGDGSVAAQKEVQAATAAEVLLSQEAVLTTLGARVERLVASTHADNVVVAISRRYHRLLSNVVAELQRLPVHIVLVPDVADLTILNVGITELGNTPALKLRAPILTDMQLALKRGLDLAIVLVMLPFLVPLMGLLALVIRLDSPGPAIFKQRRVGQYGKQFTIFKFRTMVADAEQRLREVTSYNEEGKPIFESEKGDPRVTRAGRILRRLSLDELPQLFNVLLGQMSLVGPRPELPTYVGLYDKWQHFRLWVPPGITGWWQVKGREKQPMYLYWDDDLYYIRNYSLLLDLQILWLTLSRALLGSTGR